MTTIPTGPAAPYAAPRVADQPPVRDAAHPRDVSNAADADATARQRSARQGPLVATNEDRDLYQASLGVDVSRAETLPIEVALMEAVRRHERPSGPITPDLVMRVHQTATTQDRDSAVAQQVTSFARSALSHLQGRGFSLTPEMESLVSGGGVTRFA